MYTPFYRPRLLFIIGCALVGCLLACGNSAPEVDKNLDALPDPIESELRKADWTAQDSLADDSVNIYIRPLTDQD